MATDRAIPSTTIAHEASAEDAAVKSVASKILFFNSFHPSNGAHPSSPCSRDRRGSIAETGSSPATSSTAIPSALSPMSYSSSSYSPSSVDSGRRPSFGGPSSPKSHLLRHLCDGINVSSHRCRSPRKHRICSAFWSICDKTTAGALLRCSLPTSSSSFSSTPVHTYAQPHLLHPQGSTNPQYAFVDLSLSKLAQLAQLSDDKRAQQVDYLATYPDLCLSIEFPSANCPKESNHRPLLLRTLKDIMDSCSSLRALEVATSRGDEKQEERITEDMANGTSTFTESAATVDALVSRQEHVEAEQLSINTNQHTETTEHFHYIYESLRDLICRSIDSLDALFLDHHLTSVLPHLLPFRLNADATSAAALSGRTSNASSQNCKQRADKSLKRLSLPALTRLHLGGGTAYKFSHCRVLGSLNSPFHNPPDTNSCHDQYSDVYGQSLEPSNVCPSPLLSSPSLSSSHSLHLLSLLHIPHLQSLKVNVWNADDFPPVFEFLRSLPHRPSSICQEHTGGARLNSALNELNMQINISDDPPVAVRHALVKCPAVYLPKVSCLELSNCRPLPLLICSGLQKLHLSSPVKADLLALCVSACREHLRTLHVQQIAEVNATSWVGGRIHFVIPFLAKYSGTTRLFACLPELTCPALTHLQVTDLNECHHKIQNALLVPLQREAPEPIAASSSPDHQSTPSIADPESKTTDVPRDLPNSDANATMYHKQRGTEILYKQGGNNQLAQNWENRTVAASFVSFLSRHQSTIEHLACDSLPFCRQDEESGRSKHLECRTTEHQDNSLFVRSLLSVPLEFTALKTLDVFPARATASLSSSSTTSTYSTRSQIVDVRIFSRWRMPVLRELYVHGRVFISDLYQLLGCNNSATSLTGASDMVARCPHSPVMHSESSRKHECLHSAGTSTTQDRTGASSLLHLSVHTLLPRGKAFAAQKELVSLLASLSHLKSLQVVYVPGMHPYVLQSTFTGLKFVKSDVVLRPLETVGPPRLSTRHWPTYERGATAEEKERGDERTIRTLRKSAGEEDGNTRLRSFVETQKRHSKMTSQTFGRGNTMAEGENETVLLSHNQTNGRKSC